MGQFKILLFVILGWASAEWAICQNTASIEGRVRTENGQSIPVGVTVRLETAEAKLVSEQPANSDGQYQFANLAKMSYRVTASAHGFQTAQQEIDASYAGGKAYVNLFLKPSRKANSDSPNLPALTDIRAPGRARKEYEKGVRGLERGLLAESRVHFEKATREWTCYARAQTALGWVLMSQHDFPNAEAALKKALECDRGIQSAYVYLGDLFNTEKRFAESESILQAGVRLFPGAWQFYYQLGAAHFGLGQYAKAEEEYLKVRSLNSAPPPEWHVKLADLYSTIGAYGRAYEEMKAYLRADPNGPFAGKIRAIMQKMESSGALSTIRNQAESRTAKP